MVELYEEKERFRNLYAKVSAMLQENEVNRQSVCNKNVLNGPTLSKIFQGFLISLFVFLDVFT